MAGQCCWYVRVSGSWYYIYLPHGTRRDKDFEWWVGLQNRQHQTLQIIAPTNVLTFHLYQTFYTQTVNARPLRCNNPAIYLNENTNVK